MDSELEAAIENIILGWIGNGGEMEELQPVVDAARKYANLLRVAENDINVSELLRYIETRLVSEAPDGH